MRMEFLSFYFICELGTISTKHSGWKTPEKEFVGLFSKFLTSRKPERVCVTTSIIGYIIAFIMTQIYGSPVGKNRN